MKAWHFTTDWLRDRRPVPEIGVPLRHEGRILMCFSGLHASLEPYDALQYAPGPRLHLVECRGEIVHDTDKLVARERTILASIDATDLLYYYARMRLLSVAHFFDLPQVALDYLMTGEGQSKVHKALWPSGQTRDSSPGTTLEMARIAMLDGILLATSRNPCLAARGADSNAAWSTAWMRVFGLSWSAAQDAARSAAREEFNSLVLEAFADYL